MWECQECGQENDDNFPNCMSCGIERESATAPPPAAPEPEPVRVPTPPRSEWDLTRTVARVVSFLGWATVGLGFVGIPIFHVVTESGRNARSTEMLGLFLQVAAICALGLVLVLFGHVARAVVDIAESKRS